MSGPRAARMPAFGRRARSRPWSGMLRRRACVAVCVLACSTLPGWVRAQDFLPAEPAGPSGSAAVLLDRALPVAGGWHVEALTTSWLGVPGLVTRGVCANVAARSLSVAAGAAETGEAPVGWMAGGVAIGAVAEGFGVGLRAVARRELDSGAAPRSRGDAEVGGGAWLRAAPGVRVWARAPQLAAAGPAPPLSRGLGVGVSAEREDAGAWFEREAPARTADEAGTQAAGVWLRLDAARIWVEGRSRPVRAGFGLTLAGLSVRAIGHPRLGDTITLSLSFPARRSPE